MLRCDDPIRDAGTLLCPAYDAPPESDPLASAASPRILQLLLQLEHAGDWPTARGLATQIDRESRDELAVIPLWQLADHYAWRSRLQGPGKTADQLYQGIEGWEIRPWIARDPWETGPKPLSSVGGGSVPRPGPIRPDLTGRRQEPAPTTNRVASAVGGRVDSLAWLLARSPGNGHQEASQQ